MKMAMASSSIPYLSCTKWIIGILVEVGANLQLSILGPLLLYTKLPAKIYK